jgi:hypothetical protein
MHAEFWLESLKGRALERPYLDMVMFKWTLRKQGFGSVDWIHLARDD